MRVVFLHGPAASGKYTIGKQVAQQLGLPLFHNHLAVDAALSLFAFGTEGFCRIRAGIWQLCFEEAAAASQSFVFTFHPEASVDPALVQRLVATVEAHGGHVAFVELACSVEATVARLGEPSRAAFKKLADPVLYRAIEQSGGFAFPPLPAPLLRVDIEQHNPQQAADIIVAALAAG
ncbi:MAG: hypothetical protein GAK31_01017 [Stenotrophomonas maltophilia]|uniref:Shikimate kinase n=1 Tax=Stenotrophomonas maltophilia TaxID=40324 RepID=A0A7V8FGP4_STEMA|nr:MAG: hypothetical protein GAK31_01017 [Stenotrophomonas maltophilia]